MCVYTSVVLGNRYPGLRLLQSNWGAEGMWRTPRCQWISVTSPPKMIPHRTHTFVESRSACLQSPSSYSEFVFSDLLGLIVWGCSDRTSGPDSQHVALRDCRTRRNGAGEAHVRLGSSGGMREPSGSLHTQQPCTFLPCWPLSPCQESLERSMPYGYHLMHCNMLSSPQDTPHNESATAAAAAAAAAAMASEVLKLLELATQSSTR